MQTQRAEINIIASTVQHNTPLIFVDQLSALLKDSQTAPSRVCSRTKTGNNAAYFRDRIIQSMSSRPATRVPSRARMKRAGCGSPSSPYSLGRDKLFFPVPPNPFVF